jgi:hypothetical protein
MHDAIRQMVVTIILIAIVCIPIEGFLLFMKLLRKLDDWRTKRTTGEPSSFREISL